MQASSRDLEARLVEAGASLPPALIEEAAWRRQQGESGEAILARLRTPDGQRANGGLTAHLAEAQGQRLVAVVEHWFQAGL